MMNKLPLLACLAVLTLNMSAAWAVYDAAAPAAAPQLLRRSLPRLS